MFFFYLFKLKVKVVQKLRKKRFKEWPKIRILFIKFVEIFIIFGIPTYSELRINITLLPLFFMTFDLIKSKYCGEQKVFI